MDLLSEVLESVRLRAFVHGRNEFRAPWGFRVPRGTPLPEGLADDLGVGRSAHAPDEPTPGPAASFYAVTQGQCWLEVDDAAGPPLALGGGDLVMITGDRSYQLHDDLASPVRPVWEVVTAQNFRERGGVHHGGRGPITSLVVGGYFVDGNVQDRFIAALPPLILVRAGAARAAPWIADAIRILAHETAAYEPGAQSIINHLAYALFVQAVRTHVSDSALDGNNNWLRALLDPEIGPALGLIHTRPAEPWTVDSLARHVAMSRSRFAARFRELIGAPPLQYLTHHRMRTAAQLLQAGRLAAKEVAQRVGYESEAAFSTAFKKTMRESPHAYRQRNRDGGSLT